MTALNFEAVDLPRMTVRERIRETLRLARITLATGEHVVARAYSDGMRLGFDGADYAYSSIRDTNTGGTR